MTMLAMRTIIVVFVLAVVAHQAWSVHDPFLPAQVDVGPDVATSTGGRQLTFISFGLSLAQELAQAIIRGNIDEAARILVRAVRGGESDSVIQGLFMADNKPGIVQTIVRALGLGLDSDELADAVEHGGQEHTETAGVVNDVLGEVNGNFQEGPPSNRQGDSAGVQAQPVYTPPPPPTIRTFVNGEEVRECRGQKEEQCCLEYNGSLSGCLCDYTGQCRFQFISTDPVIIMDTRRTDQRACSCP